jgi:CheY-like chemotaxis protein
MPKCPDARKTTSVARPAQRPSGRAKLTAVLERALAAAGRLRTSGDPGTAIAWLQVIVPVKPIREPAPVIQTPLRLHAPSTLLLAHAMILVVDDDAESRWFVSTIFSRLGATVTRASSAPAAFAAVQRGPPDLVVSDIDMPSEEGYALMRKIRALSAEAGGLIPAIAFTAGSRVDEVQRALLAGFTTHLAKPASAIQLIDMAIVLTRSGPIVLEPRP